METTEEKIIVAAREVFLKKGMDGARMQEIADEAGINKSLLHYYFRSKEKLFNEVFNDTFKSLLDAITIVFETSNSLDSFIENFVIGYTSVLREKPYIPNFVFHELTQNPQRVVQHISSSNFDKSRIIGIIASEKNENIRAYDPIQIIIDVVALSVFPFVAKPIISGFIFEGNSQEYNKFMEQRTQHIIDFVKAAVFIQQ